MSRKQPNLEATTNIKKLLFLMALGTKVHQSPLEFFCNVDDPRFRDRNFGRHPRQTIDKAKHMLTPCLSALISNCLRKTNMLWLYQVDAMLASKKNMEVNSHNKASECRLMILWLLQTEHKLFSIRYSNTVHEKKTKLWEILRLRIIKK